MSKQTRNRKRKPMDQARRDLARSPARKGGVLGQNRLVTLDDVAARTVQIRESAQALAARLAVECIATVQAVHDAQGTILQAVQSARTMAVTAPGAEA